MPGGPGASRTHYEVLGVPRFVDRRELAAAYHRLARQYHPDVNPSPEAAEMMRAINVAHGVLKHEDQRREYDASLAAGGHPVSQPLPAWGPGEGAISRRAEAVRAASSSNAPAAPVLDFGRYAGWDLETVRRLDPEYAEWFLTTPRGRRLVGATHR